MELKRIHGDKRGTISILLGCKETPEVTVFQTNKGYARGGCIHPKSEELCVVIEGSIKYKIMGQSDLVLVKGSTVCIPKNTPHCFVALEDCIVMEWGATPEEKQIKHVEYRAIVDQTNAMVKEN